MEIISIFKEKNGKYSFSRIISTICIISYLLSFWYKLLIYNEIIDIPIQVAGLIAVLYGSNKITDK